MNSHARVTNHTCIHVPMTSPVAIQPHTVRTAEQLHVFLRVQRTVHPERDGGSQVLPAVRAAPDLCYHKNIWPQPGVGFFTFNNRDDTEEAVGRLNGHCVNRPLQTTSPPPT
jgi:hypothetical protein